MTFDDILKTAPQIILQKLEDLKTYKENPKWHPEDNCYIHVNVITDRCLKTKNRNLVMIGLLHDICKKDSSKFNPKTGYMMSPGHDKMAVDLINNHKEIQEYIVNFGADLEIVKWVIGQHMRIAQINNMRKRKQYEILNHEYYDILEVFHGFDNMLISEVELEIWFEMAKTL